MDASIVLPLTLSWILIGIVILFDKKAKLKLWKDILAASILSVMQLVGIGFLLMFLLKVKSTYVNFAIVVSMLINAAFISNRRMKIKAYRKLHTFLLILCVLSITTIFIMFGFFITGIIDASAVRLIPMAGLITAAGMRSLSFSINSLQTKLRDTHETIVGIVALGASDTQAFSFIFKDLISDVTVPVRDMLKSSGIVHIPGIMVGLLMAGAIPVKAAIIQFAILTSMLFEFVFVPSTFLFLLIKLFGLKIQL